MDSPVPLLSLAVINSYKFYLKVKKIYENDVNSRTNLVVKACKIITDILPFDRKNHILIEEPELMKYLMLAIPLNPNAVSLHNNFLFNALDRLNYHFNDK